MTHWFGILPISAHYVSSTVNARLWSRSLSVCGHPHVSCVLYRIREGMFRIVSFSITWFLRNHSCLAGLRLLTRSLHVLCLISYMCSSLLHQWIWLVIQHMRLPHGVLLLLQASYCNFRCAIRFRGRLLRWVLIFRRLNQGCLAAGSIWALCVDPLLRYLFSRILPVTCFADDVAITIRYF